MPKTIAVTLINNSDMKIEKIEAENSDEDTVIKQCAELFPDYVVLNWHEVE